MKRKNIAILAIIPLNIFLFASCSLFGSCSTIQAGLYLLSLDRNPGEFYIQNEPIVKSFLENVINSPDEYTIKAFERTGINYDIKRTYLLTHCYYVIFNNDGSYHTLSFNGTKITFASKGAWALDTETDASSHKMYLEGENLWGVDEIFMEDTIDVKETAQNITNMIGSDITYYYKDHVNDKPKRNNCITALYETVTLGECELIAAQ
jgi:hypothetical protein